MIDEALTRKRLSVAPYGGKDPKVKGRYRRMDYVVVRCDKCNSVYGKAGRVLYFYVLQRREENSGKDLCATCWRNQKYPLRLFENAQTEFLRIVSRNNGEIPRFRDLPWNLISAINTHHGMYQAFVRRCGLTLKRKPSKYWKKWENLEAEVRPMCDDLGFFPPDQYLLSVNSALRTALNYFGGPRKVAKRMGYKLATGYEADDGHFVLSYYEFAVDNILFTYGVPHQTYPQIRRGDKRRADFKVGKTLIEVAGFSSSRQSSRHREYHSNLQAKLALYEELGIPAIVIYKEDFGDIGVVLGKLNAVIREYSKGDKEVDITNAIRPVSWWSDWHNVKPLLQEVVDHIGHFPSARELAETGKGQIAQYITRFHGGFAEARRRIGAEVRQESPGYFGKWENVVKTFRPVCERLGYFPTAEEIRARKYGLVDCSTGLYKYWGGISNVAKRLGYPTKRDFNRAKRREFWSNWENVAGKLQDIGAELGHFPTDTELEQRSQYVLLWAIREFHGGLPAAKQKLGTEPLLRVPNGYYSDWANVEETFAPICQTLGHFPGTQHFRERWYGLTDCLATLRKYWGTIPNVAHGLGYPTKPEFERGIRRAKN